MTASILLALQACDAISGQDVSPSDNTTAAMLADGSSGDNWAGYGGTYGEQHFSPLTEISDANISGLGLAWYMDLAPGNSATIPLEIDGVLYFASGLSVVHAVDAASGKLLWRYDPEVAKVAGKRMRPAWGSRGIGYWEGRIYVGTLDGRLIAIDAKTGKPDWSVLTVEKDDYRFITGAPRLFDGKVIIGHGGADTAATRGYVTTYDATTGKQLWRFYVVPGNPADGFEDEAQEMAARTWSGEWWKHGGGGTAWNAMTYDAETDTIMIGTGNGAPWNRRIRSADRGDNLFLCSIVALDAKTGRYKWHYQYNPGEAWDYNGVMDMHLATLTIDGKPRKVVMSAPKNGFLYVIDRTNGKLISAEKIARVTWADRIDIETGRPVERPDARYPDGKTVEIWPSPSGAHTWTPSAYNPVNRIMYVPVNLNGAKYSDRGISPKNWQRKPYNANDAGVNLQTDIDDPLNRTSYLIAWNPVTQRQVWKQPTPANWNGGLLTTAGNLLFQGQVDGQFKAYAADTGKPLWSLQAQTAIVSAPITYLVNGRQYVTVIVGLGTSAATVGKTLGRTIDYRTQPRRVLTFALGGNRQLPPAPEFKLIAAPDPDFAPSQAADTLGAETYGRNCAACHGTSVIAGGGAPDLRASSAVMDKDVFGSIVRDGILLENGMPRYGEFDDRTLGAVRQYIRTRASDLRAEQALQGR